MPQGHKSGRKTIMTRLMPLGQNPSTRLMPQGHKVNVYGNFFDFFSEKIENFYFLNIFRKKGFGKSKSTLSI